MIICADDYGMRDDINEGILELCRLGRLTAVSCMAVFKQCDIAGFRALLEYQARVDIGLHLCLTDENLPLESLGGMNTMSPGEESSASPPEKGREVLALPPFPRLFRRAMLGRVRPEEVASQLAAQYALFIEKTGRAPDFIDGHLHAHQLPGVAQGVVDFVLSLPTGSRPYVRNTRLPLATLLSQRLPFSKALAVGAFGSRMARRLHRAGLPTNNGFAGIYDFKQWRGFGAMLPRFAQALPDANGILVCHPSSSEAWRKNELETLRGFDFGGRLNRFKR